METLNHVFVIKIIISIILMIVTIQEEPNDDGQTLFPMLMPDVQPIVKDTYLCTAFRIPQTDLKYIIEFTPNASMQTVHHMSVFGCDTPGQWDENAPKLVWECTIEQKPRYGKKPVCNSGMQMLYVWAKNAPTLKLPEGVAFNVGEESGMNFLVLQVHYADVETFLMGGKDHSGIILTMLPSSTDKVTKSAGLYVLGTGLPDPKNLVNASGMIPAKEEKHFESACRNDEVKKMHPFAFRTHTHALGKVVSGYKIDKNRKWHLIGKRNPQEPQMFYPIEDEDLIIEKGDILAARCTMYNFRNHTTYIGLSHEDEMCVFYIMYYMEADNPIKRRACIASGQNSYYWSTDPMIESVPTDIDLSASTLDV